MHSIAYAAVLLLYTMSCTTIYVVIFKYKICVYVYMISLCLVHIIYFDPSDYGT